MLYAEFYAAHSVQHIAAPSVQQNQASLQLARSLCIAERIPSAASHSPNDVQPAVGRSTE